MPIPISKSQPEKVKALFPCYPITIPFVFEECAPNLNLWTRLHTIFNQHPHHKIRITLHDSTKLKGKGKNNGKT